MQGDSDECYHVSTAIIQLRKLQSPIVACDLPSDSQTDRTPTILTQFQNGNDQESDILTFSYRLGDVWLGAREYAAARPTANRQQLPPWNPQSDYSSVMQRHLEFDSSVPLRFRFAANKFGEQSLEALQRDRAYWSPWLLMQMVYAAIPCLLNHPFLLSMRLRDFRRTMPQMFIDHSFEHINRHAGWIIFFLDLIDKKGFEPADPILAHAVVIVATIHLQHSFAEDTMLQTKAKDGFEKCMVFLVKMGRTLPVVSIMVRLILRTDVLEVGLPKLNVQNRHRISKSCRTVSKLCLFRRLHSTLELSNGPSMPSYCGTCSFTRELEEKMANRTSPSSHLH